MSAGILALWRDKVPPRFYTTTVFVLKFGKSAGMKRELIRKAVRMTADEAISRVNELLTSRARLMSEDEWHELEVLGCSLNNLWPKELQEPVWRWIAALVPVAGESQDHAFRRRLLRALFWSLCKRKREVQPIDEIESAFWEFEEKADPLSAAHDTAALIVTTNDRDVIVAAMLNLSRYFYELSGQEEFESLMMEVLAWAALRPGSDSQTIAAVVHAVHTEFRHMRVDVARSLTGANHLGPFLPFWALFQLDDTGLLKLRNELGVHEDASEMTKAVFEELCTIRLDLV